MNFAIIVAAGKGSRMNEKINKAFLLLGEKPTIYYALNAFENSGLIDEITIVAQKDDFKKIEQINKKYGFGKIKKIVEGGKERQDSVYNGLISIKKAKDDDIVLVHNASNPFIKEEEIFSCIKAAKEHGAAVVGFPLKDTIKKIKDDFVDKTIDRENVYQVQTPQGAKYRLFIDAYKNAKIKSIKATDDVSLVEALGKKVKIIPCSYENIKITTKDDLKIAEGILDKKSDFKVGIGQDSHKFAAKNKKLILGGFIIPGEIGLNADSDGDVILHALFNAISSAIGGKSLGHYANPMCEKGVKDSKEYLKVVLKQLNDKSLRINNISISIEAKKPRLEKHTESIKKSLSSILGLEKERIGITCTSGDELTSFGKGEGMQCFIVVTIK